MCRNIVYGLNTCDGVGGGPVQICHHLCSSSDQLCCIFDFIYFPSFSKSAVSLCRGTNHQMEAVRHWGANSIQTAVPLVAGQNKLKGERKEGRNEKGRDKGRKEERKERGKERRKKGKKEEKKEERKERLKEERKKRWKASVVLLTFLYIMRTLQNF